MALRQVTDLNGDKLRARGRRCIILSLQCRVSWHLQHFALGLCLMSVWLPCSAHLSALFCSPINTRNIRSQ